MLKGRKILLGITGSIAAYKAAFLVRELSRQEAEVRVVMTPDSVEFISPLTLSTLSKNQVLIHWKDETETWNNHVELGLWADLFIIAPCSANTLAKMNQGICDNLLLATYLSAKCPVAFAPAMDLDMYQHFTTQRNIRELCEQGYYLIDSEEGELASGLVGKGRMAEPDNIVRFIDSFFNNSNLQKNKLFGKKVLITAGPTFEAIDPVRFIGNRSSGKMGIALAQKAADMGADVHLIIGPTSENLDQLGQCSIIRVETAQEMFTTVQNLLNQIDIGIFSAAVADYRPKEIAKSKIKKKSDVIQLELVKNPDILKYAGENKEKLGYLLVGFALETDKEEENAIIKLRNKNLDFIVLNSLQDKGAGFSTTTNKITIIDSHNKITKFELKSKAEVADDILNVIANEI
ncbi:MAG: bifunctional phosphopantothenoylcysteine decarboxylase/phosphopantothenate--cysteine ligase CoaBC [Crocinitomicaceae bacterium]